MPSRTRPNWKEQFGRVIIEAMACGVPVIGSDSGEIPHVIGDAGLVFSEGDAGGLRDHLARLQAEPGLAEALGELGRQRVLEHFTQASIARRTAAVYAEMMSRRFWGYRFERGDLEHYGVWTGGGGYEARTFNSVRYHADRLEQPLHWRNPQRVFTPSMGDLFQAEYRPAFGGQKFCEECRA